MRTVRHRDLSQYNWYQYALKGFTDTQRLKYPRNARYYTQAVLATPRWSDMSAVWDLFLFARLLRMEGLAVEVDHIIPLNHPYVCGMHCRENMRIITSQENNAKGNHIWPDSWHEQLDLWPKTA